MTARHIIAAALALALALPAAGCGIKGAPKPPSATEEPAPADETQD